MIKNIQEVNNKALSWFKAMSIKEQREIHSKSTYSHYPFIAFAKSTHAIRLSYIAANIKES